MKIISLDFLYYNGSGRVVPFFARMCVHIIEGATEL